jgi:hypothetical protein
VAPGACTIKLFTDFGNKLECLSLASLSRKCLWVRPGADPRMEHIPKVLYLGRLQPYLQTLDQLETIAKDRHSSLLKESVNYDLKKVLSYKLQHLQKINLMFVKKSLVQSHDI